MIGLGGSEALAAEVCASRRGASFASPGFWRAALAWLVRWEAEIDRAQVGPIIDYLDTRSGEPPDQVLRGRTPASLARMIEAWHLSLFRIRARGSRSWPRSRWRELVQVVPSPGDDRRSIEWRLIELLDNAQLTEEGHAMHHCVATYLWRCVHGHARIWSLRRRVLDPDGAGRPRSMLTIEIDPRSGTIVQVRGFANRRASGQPLELVRGWPPASSCAGRRPHDRSGPERCALGTLVGAPRCGHPRSGRAVQVRRGEPDEAGIPGRPSSWAPRGP